jgi:nitroreductase
MDIEQLLTTTRSARKTLDVTTPVDLGEIATCLRTGLQAPNGTNMQSWRWIVVADADKRAQIGALYRDAYLSMTGGTGVAELLGTETDLGRVVSSTEWLVEHLPEVPVFVIPCYEPYTPRSDGDDPFFQASLYGSIFPAVWSFQLALRTQGYGTCITTLHLRRAAEVAEVLGIPGTYQHGCLLPVARLRNPHHLPRPASRRPLEEVTAVDGWNGPPLV